MVNPQGLFPDLQCTLKQRFGLGIVTLLTVEDRQIVECEGYIRMVSPQCVLLNVQCTLKQRLGLDVLTLLMVEDRQAIERIGYTRMVSTEHQLIDTRAVLNVGFRFGIPRMIPKI